MPLDAVSRRTVLSGLAAGTAVALTGEGLRAQQNRPLVVAIPADMLASDPHKLVAGFDHALFANTFESLLGTDADGNVVPALAEKMTVSSDGLVYSFALRPNVKWHNGDPFTADDVVASWKRAIDPAIKNPRAGTVAGKIVDIEVVDPLNVRLKLAAPDAALPENMPTYWYITPKKYLEAVGDEGFAKAPVGTGPYQLVERKPREYLKLSAFEQHWGGAPKIKDVIYKIVPDDQARIAQIQTGEADMVVTVPLIFAARMQNTPGFKIVRVTSFNNGVLVINNRGNNPFLRDRNVRVALNMAINKPALAKALTFGFASLHELPCTKGMIACDHGMVKPYGYDPKAAKELLTKAGYDFNRPLKVVGAATGRVIQGKETVEGIAQFLNAVGIKTEVVVLEYGAWATTAFAKEKDPSIDLYYLTAPDASRDAAPRLSRIIKTGETMSFYSDTELDRAFETAFKMPTSAQYEEALKGVYRKVHDDAVTIPLWSYDSIYAVRDTIAFTPYQNISWPILRGASWKAA